MGKVHRRETLISLPPSSAISANKEDLIISPQTVKVADIYTHTLGTETNKSVSQAASIKSGWIIGDAKQAKIRSSSSVESNAILSESTSDKWVKGVVNKEKYLIPISINKIAQKVAAAAQSAIKQLQFTYLNKGAAKVVWTTNSKEDTHLVFFTARNKGKLAELQEEVRTAATIKKRLEDKGLNEEANVELRLDVVEDENRMFNGQYTVESNKAGEAGGKNVMFDQVIRDPNTTRSQRFEFAGQIVNGINNIHEAGFVHGDLKGDNILHYKVASKAGDKESVLRVSDFGKSRDVSENGSVLHTGNARYMAPEGRSSKKAEVYSAALLIVRSLEEEFLGSKDMLISPRSKKIGTKETAKNLRGIEKFVVTNSLCRQTDSKSIFGMIRLIKGFVAAKLNVFSNDDKKAAEREVREYIGALFSKMHKDRTLNEGQKEALEDIETLLNEMVSSNPKDRPTMQEVKNRYTAAKEKYLA